MKIVCSSGLAYGEEAFGTLGDAVVRDGRAIGRDDMRDADLLATRSTTKVDAALLDGSPVRFVGTATIGTDHLDIAHLESRDITWCAAPGCNANSVSEYVTAALLTLAVRHGFTLEGRTLGVVGVGNVGSQVIRKARALGLRVLANDPPRERNEGASVPLKCPGQGEHREDDVVALSSLDDVLAGSDILTLHVPLEKEGTDATFHLAGRAFFDRLRPGCVFLNSARGAIVDTEALLQALDTGTVAHAVMDTWEGEPAYRPDLLERVDIATPHIAGYSFDGKVLGTEMIYESACRFLDREPAWSPEALLPEPDVPELSAHAFGCTGEALLCEFVRCVYNIEADDRAMRESVHADDRERADAFDRLRKGYPVRREFRFTRVTGVPVSDPLYGKLMHLGFQVP